MTTNDDSLIRVRGLSKRYRLRGEEVHALRDVNLDVARGEYLSIMGPSGSGKSTLFNLIGALDRPTAGTVQIGPLDLTTLGDEELAYVRCQYIGYIFQTYNLVLSLTALANVALPCLFRGDSPEAAEAAAARVLERVGLGHRLTHRPGELSGGQQQRVAIARALVNEPAILLADEPTGNLDLQTGDEVIALLKGLAESSGVSVISATHDHKMLSRSDRVLWIRDGRVERIQNRDELNIVVGELQRPAVAGSRGASS